jgi:hypothetical protein
VVDDLAGFIPTVDALVSQLTKKKRLLVLTSEGTGRLMQPLVGHSLLVEATPVVESLGAVIAYGADHSHARDCFI